MARQFDLPGIVAWGRPFDEYRAFFALDEPELASMGPVLDVGGGPSSFTAEATAKGIKAVAVDPLYAFAHEAIQARFDETRRAMMKGLERARDRFVWQYYSSPRHLERLRCEALAIFLNDYEPGKNAGRYVLGSLPVLPFPDATFGLALCSHLLFLYSDELDLDFHVAAILELLRVADEARIFPLINLDGSESIHLSGTMAAIRETGHLPEIVSVPFEFQRGAHQMLRVRTVRSAS